METIFDQILNHPWRSFLTAGLSLFGVITGLNQLFGLTWQLGLIIMLAYLIIFLIVYAGLSYEKYRVHCYSSQSEAGQAICKAVQEATRSVKILSFTCETLYNLLSQALIERLLDRGVEFRVLMATPNSPYYLRDDTRERYEEIIRTYIQRWTDLMKPRRQLHLRVYDSVPLLRCIIVDDEKCFIGSYFAPNFDVGDVNSMFEFLYRPPKGQINDTKVILVVAFDYLWSQSRPARSDEGSVSRPKLGPKSLKSQS